MTNLVVSAYDALLEMTMDEILAALLLSAIAAMTLSGIFALMRKRTSDSPPLVGAMVLVACAASVALALGYARLKHTGGGTGQFLGFLPRTPPTGPGGVPAGSLAGHPFVPRLPGAGFLGGPPGFAGSVFSRVLMDAYDLDHDGRLTRDEAAHAMADILKDGDGHERDSIERGDIERLINRRLRVHEPPYEGGWNPRESRSTSRSSVGAPVVHSSSNSSPRSG